MSLNSSFASFLIQAANGERKVYIAELYDRIAAYANSDLDTFKSTLFRLNASQFARGGEDLGFTLSRSDLSYEDDQETVEASEIGGFHYFTVC